MARGFAPLPFLKMNLPGGTMELIELTKGDKRALVEKGSLAEEQFKELGYDYPEKTEPEPETKTKKETKKKLKTKAKKGA
jgi:hypothetical protein